jgi:hypothetical protein
MNANQTKHTSRHDAEVADKAYLFWVRIEALSDWIMEHYWYEISDRIEARLCMDQWPEEIGSQTKSTVP